MHSTDFIKSSQDHRGASSPLLKRGTPKTPAALAGAQENKLPGRLQQLAFQIRALPPQTLT
jgi:hypothetical protein